jgi:hypothetical protein
MRKLAVLLLLLCWIPGLPASFGLKGDVRIAAAGEGLYWAGQERELYLELWTNGFSFAGQQFVLPEVHGGFLLQPDSSTVKLTENRRGESWQGLRYTLLLYPQLGGKLVVPSFRVSFEASSGFGREQRRFEFRTEPLTLEAQMPPGAPAGGLLVTTTSFDLAADWSPAGPADGKLSLLVGDALTLTVERTASAVPGMVFPPLPDIEIDGLASYPAAPNVRDRVNRGDLVGSRVDSLTLVAEREGEFTLPEIRFGWWDPGRETYAEKVIGAVDLTVAPNPAMPETAASATGGGPAGPAKKAWWFIGMALLAAAVAARWLWPRLSRQIRYRRAGRRKTEAWAFGQLVKDCRAGSAVEAYRAATLWLQRFPHAGARTLTEWAERVGNDALGRAAADLQRHVAGLSAGEWRGRELAELLEQSRNQSRQASRGKSSLHPLNP